MARPTDEHMLQGLLSSFNQVLPEWVRSEGQGAPAPEIRAEHIAACREAAHGDRILAAFAQRLTELMSSQKCAGRVRAQELLLACAEGERAPKTPSDCALTKLGLCGPCSFRCQSDTHKNTLGLWREAIRYMETEYAFSPGKEALAGNCESVKRAVLAPMSLEPK